MNCKFCNQTTKNNKTFCSTSCHARYANLCYQKKHQILTKPLKECLNCKKLHKNIKFCSRNCAGIYNNKFNINVIQSRKIRTKKCRKCDNLIWSAETHCKNCKRKTKLFSKFDNITIKELEYGKEQLPFNKHVKIRDRARTTYKHSNKPKNCVICGYSLHCDICHIKAISTFDPNTNVSEVNSLNNLIALCKNHHWEFDHGYISEEKLRCLMN